MNKLRLKGRRALVTGAARGIGLAAAARLGREGADLIAVDMEGSPWDELRAQIAAAGGNLLIHEGDVASSDAWSTLVERIDDQDHLGRRRQP